MLSMTLHDLKHIQLCYCQQLCYPSGNVLEPKVADFDVIFVMMAFQGICLSLMLHTVKMH